MNRDPGAEKSFPTTRTQCLECWEKKQVFNNVWVVSFENSGHFEICQPGMCLSPWENAAFNDSFNSYEE